MGKVQDTISRISRRRKQRSQADIALIIPSQQKPTSHSFPTTCKGVSSWLASQPNTSAEGAIAGLLKALQHSNRLQTSPSERLLITDLFRSRLQQFVPQLNAQYIGMDLPYTSSAQLGFEQVSSLLQELSYGYKIALVDVLSRRGRLGRKYRIYSIFRAMMATGECGLRHSQSYCSWPEQSWRDLNSLLSLAENENASDEIINAGGSAKQSRPNTIHQLYKALAAFSASKTQHLQAIEMDSLFTALCKHSDAISLSKERTSQQTGLLSVSLNTDNPPAVDMFSRHVEDTNIRYLSLENLFNTLLANDNIEQDQSGLNKLQLNKLNDIWTQQQTRSNARSIRHQSFSTETNVKEIASALLSQPGALDPEFDLQFQTSWTLVNESKTGVCLRTNPEQKPEQNYRASVGETIAYRCEMLVENTFVCQVGIIRWIHSYGPNDLQIGVETIGDTVKAVSLQRIGNSDSGHHTRIDALIFTDPGKTYDQHLLLVPRRKLKLGEIVEIQTESGFRPQMKLGEKLELNANIDCFALNSRPSVSTNAIQAVMRKTASS